MIGKWGKKGIKVLTIGLILVLLVVGYHYHLSNRAARNKRQEEVQVTEVQKALSRNLAVDYPPTPREVVKYYAELTQCLYNETYTEEEFQKLALQIQGLYDDELIANNAQEQYFSSLKWDIDQFEQQGIEISSYSLSSSTDVEEYNKGGYSWAKLYCTFTLRVETYRDYSREVVLLRKDEDGHWKIYGWELAEDAETAE